MSTPESWATEHEFPLPDGSGKWVVRAFEFATGELAYAEWERVQGHLRGKAEGNFSLWRTMLPDGSAHLVVVCGRPEDMPKVGGESYNLDYDNARAFALRRARAGMDAFAEGTDVGEHFEHEAHYDQPMQIDPTSGYVKRWYRT